MSVDLGALYARRFGPADHARKERIWAEICRYLQRFVPRDGSVLDVACDRGYFIRHIAARERWAADVRDVRADLPADVTFVRADVLALDGTISRTFDRIFISNLLEHLRDADEVVRVLAVSRSLLSPGGRLIVLQPNIRLIGSAYWDFLDHRVALTARSLVEAAELAGLRPVHMIERFLPYTTKSRLPGHPALVRLYLALPPLWRLLGKQTLLIAAAR
jgi:2-polyprenyl-3-methyl-5-hydroxy-6-metoxy-1,4-benzoquinol methylase